jgi:2-(1,2-epoxy-1,2-dihydrophenyl)acetyl-CoA isomerase
MADYETLNLIRDGALATIELDRPEVMNAWNTPLGTDLRHAVETVADDESVRVVLVRGAGRAFSSGADLKEGFEAGDDGRPQVYRRLTELYHPIITGIRRMPKPVVAAVHGPAVGIGCSLALACDLIVASESAYFLLAFVNIGLMPDGGSTLFVPSRVGHTRAAEMAMLGERVAADQALQWGLINRVFPDDGFDAGVKEITDRLAAGPPRSLAASKRALNAWVYPRMDEQLELEAQSQQELARTDDFLEGVSAFLQKRPAEYKGA